MTAIVGIAHEGVVWIGGDSAGVGSGISNARADAKVFSNGHAVFGFTSSFRMGQLLRFSLKMPDRCGLDLEHWLSTSFVDAVRQCLKDGGSARKDSEVESCGTFLLGIEGRIFTIDSDFQVAENIEPWAVCGCGHAVTLGSLWTSAHVVGLRDDPETRIRLALQAAANYCTGVRGPFSIIRTRPA